MSEPTTLIPDLEKKLMHGQDTISSAEIDAMTSSTPEEVAKLAESDNFTVLELLLERLPTLPEEAQEGVLDIISKRESSAVGQVLETLELEGVFDKLLMKAPLSKEVQRALVRNRTDGAAGERITALLPHLSSYTVIEEALSSSLAVRREETGEEARIADLPTELQEGFLRAFLTYTRSQNIGTQDEDIKYRLNRSLYWTKELVESLIHSENKPRLPESELADLLHSLSRMGAYQAQAHELATSLKSFDFNTERASHIVTEISERERVSSPLLRGHERLIKEIDLRIEDLKAAGRDAAVRMLARHRDGLQAQQASMGHSPLAVRSEERGRPSPVPSRKVKKREGGPRPPTR